jgi:hypothetical protein
MKVVGQTLYELEYRSALVTAAARAIAMSRCRGSVWKIRPHILNYDINFGVKCFEPHLNIDFTIIKYL